MNSRGKTLTPFEHFKAEYEKLYENGTEESNRINYKFDVKWIDILFPYRSEGIVDREFMNYFYFISHILCYKWMFENRDNDTDQKVAECLGKFDEFEMIQLLYTDGENKNAADSRKFLEKAFDCWDKDNLGCEGNKPIDIFFDRYLSYRKYEKGKVTTFKSKSDAYAESPNYFLDCLRNYKEGGFKLNDALFLFGFITYLMNKEQITEEEFNKRLRSLRNLIWNSGSGEIRKDSMPGLIMEVENLMLSGKIEQSTNTKYRNFNKTQKTYEIEKRNFTGDADFETLNWYEDHELIYGYAYGLGGGDLESDKGSLDLVIANLDLVDSFYAIFNDNPEYIDIHQALMAIGEYQQEDSIRYYMGNHLPSTWDKLLHPSGARENFNKTMEAVITLLKRKKNGEDLQGIINSYLMEKEEAKCFDLRYYFVKYPDMLRGENGELLKAGNSFNEYDIVTLNKHRLNGHYWSSFLNVIYKTMFAEDLVKNEKDKLDDFGGPLKIGDLLLSVTDNGFKNGEDDNFLVVEQQDSVDIEDRVEKVLSKIRKLLHS